MDSSSTARLLSRRLYPLLVAVLCVIGAARIISTYTQLSQTVDEAAHIACGMEWVDRGTYTYEPLHPPLARASAAVLPYIAGAKYSGTANMIDEGNQILHTDGRYQRNLSLARLGILPYFILAVVVVWLWTRRLYGDLAGICAAAVFSLLPPVLAHAGLATTDMANTACFLLLAFVLYLWLRAPHWKQSVGLGAAVALAATVKFSSVFFLPVLAAGFIVQYIVEKRGGFSLRRLPYRRMAGQVGIVLATAFLSVWAVYHFSFGPLLTGDHLNDFRQAVEGRFGAGSGTANLLVSAVQTPVPMPELGDGIMRAFWLNSKGFGMYLLGTKLHNRGDIRFFPVVLAVKTPLAFLLLSLVGGIAVVVAARRNRQWQYVLPLYGALALLLTCLPSKINLGVRHVLPIYTFLSMLAGYALCWLFTMHPRAVGIATATLLLGWFVVSTSLIHPDYLAYFNEIGGSHPEEILIDSDLDWGQDLLRLEHRLREKNIDSVSLAYFGTADLARHNLPIFQQLDSAEAPQYRWVAASIVKVKGIDGYEWLQRYTPVELIGHSIWLYRLDPASVNTAPL